MLQLKAYDYNLNERHRRAIIVTKRFPLFPVGRAFSKLCLPFDDLLLMSTSWPDRQPEFRHLAVVWLT